MLADQYKLTEKGNFISVKDFGQIQDLRRTVMMELLYGPNDTVSLDELVMGSSTPGITDSYQKAIDALITQGYIMKDPETTMDRRLSGYSS